MKFIVYCEHETKVKIDDVHAKTWEEAWEIARENWQQYDSDELVVEKFVKASATFKKYEQEDDEYRGLDAVIKHPTEELERRLKGTEWAIIWEMYDEEDDTVVATTEYEHGYMMEKRQELLEVIKEYNK